MGTSSSHVHSSPLPFPPVHYDRLGHPGGVTAAAAAAAAGATTATPVTGSSRASGDPTSAAAAQTKMVESIRKRQYRVGLNLFNKKPERGINYLTQKVVELIELD